MDVLNGDIGGISRVWGGGRRQSLFDRVWSSLLAELKHLGASRDFCDGVLKMGHEQQRAHYGRKAGDQERLRRRAGCVSLLVLPRAVRPGAVYRRHGRGGSGVLAVGVASITAGDVGVVRRADLSTP